MAKLKIPSVARYRKRVGGFGSLDVKHDGSVLQFNTAESCYNFDFGSGALGAGYGVSANAAVHNEAQRYWIYRYYSEEAGGFVDQCFFQESHGLLMCYDSYEKELLYISGFPYPPIQAMNYRLNSKDVLLISCEGRKLIVWDGFVLKTHESSPVISSMALHYERLFVTSREEPTKVFFSDDLDPTNWDISIDGGGFIELLDERGELNKIVSFGNYLYIFRDHGISRVTAFGDQREFSVANLFMTAGRIFPSSIAVCGSCIIFLASDGLYMFDGYDCTRVLQNLDGLIVPSDVCASAYYNGRYYLACRMDFDDDKQVGCEKGKYTANGLLTYSTANGEYTITRGIDITFMNGCTYLGEDFLMCCAGGEGGVIEKNGKLFDESLPKFWKSPETDFGAPDRTKAIRELYIQGNADCKITLSSDKKTKTFKVKAGDRRVRVNFNAKRLSLAVESDAADCTIKAPTIVYSSY
ncbi:MAG: hypothetical protein J1G01_00160 [Clostridiales bacterium]|nr:hypothetical protein [Clostridiales bacterium]